MKIKIGSILETSLIDVLFHPSFVVWLSYCNFRCPWCQNGPLVKGEGKFVEIDEIIRKARNYVKFIDFFHVTGGEPTLQAKELIELLKKAKEIGYKISINTNGSRPEILQEIIENSLLDHVAIDVKAPFNKYSKLIGIEGNWKKKIEESLKIAKKVKFVEIRTTFVPNFLSKNDLLEILKEVKKVLKSFFYVIQQFRISETILDKNIEWEEIDKEKMKEIARYVKEKTNFGNIYLRTKFGIIKI